MAQRDGHVRVLPIHVANKIAAGEVVERPASVVKELVENSIDAGATSIRIAVTQGGRKLVSVQDDGCGMTKDDAVLSLERQATSKILDVDDIERIDTLGFRGEAIPSIASVSRFTITTRRRDSDEGTLVQVNAGTLAEVRAAGCPPGTLVEVRDLVCNVPARRKFLRSYATEEAHVKYIFTVHALAYPSIGFSLSVDGREAYRLPAADGLAERVRELFGGEYLERMAEVPETVMGDIRVRGFIERPDRSAPATRRDQFIFVNSRPATAPSIAYALRDAYPRSQGDARPAVVLFIDLPPSSVDVNVHPTKREVRFRDNVSVKRAVAAAVERALGGSEVAIHPAQPPCEERQPPVPNAPAPNPADSATHAAAKAPAPETSSTATPARATPVAAAVPQVYASSIYTSSRREESPFSRPETRTEAEVPPTGGNWSPAPVQVEFAVDSNSTKSRPWKRFKFLAFTESGYLLVETDSGIVTLNPSAARERIVYERLMDGRANPVSQTQLIPQTVKMSPSDAARIRASLESMSAMGFAVEDFGKNVFKIDAVPQSIEGADIAQTLSTIAQDLAEGSGRRGGERWRDEQVAKSIARSCSGGKVALNEKLSVALVEELASCRSPYVTPRGKPVMLFRSNGELRRRFGQE